MVEIVKLGQEFLSAKPRWYNPHFGSAFEGVEDPQTLLLGGTEVLSILRPQDKVQLDLTLKGAVEAVLPQLNRAGRPVAIEQVVWGQEPVEVPDVYEWIPRGIHKDIVPPNLQGTELIRRWQSARDEGGWKNPFVRWMRKIQLAGLVPPTMLVQDPNAPLQFPLRDDQTGQVLTLPVRAKGSVEVGGTHLISGALRDETAIRQWAEHLKQYGEYQFQQEVPVKRVMSPHYFACDGKLFFLGMSELEIASGTTHIGNELHLDDPAFNAVGLITHRMAQQLVDMGLWGPFGFDVLVDPNGFIISIIEANLRWNGGTSPCIRTFLLGERDAYFRFAQIPGELGGIVEDMRGKKLEHRRSKPGAQILVFGTHHIDGNLGIIVFGRNAKERWLKTVESLGGQPVGTH